MSDSLSGSFFADCCQRYETAKRYYHNLQHIEKMLRLAVEVAAEVQDVPAFLLAIWYHDIIYDPTSPQNEAESAAYMNQLWQGFVPAQTLTLATDHILATTHKLIPNHPDSQLLLDLDLAILAASVSDYANYQTAIRREYAHVPDELYRLGRTNVLQSFLQRERIFLTKQCGQWEMPARANIQAELATLAWKTILLVERFF